MANETTSHFGVDLAKSGEDKTVVMPRPEYDREALNRGIAERLAFLRTLPFNWDGGPGQPVPYETAEATLAMLTQPWLPSRMLSPRLAISKRGAVIATWVQTSGPHIRILQIVRQYHMYEWLISDSDDLVRYGTCYCAGAGDAEKTFHELVDEYLRPCGKDLPACSAAVSQQKEEVMRPQLRDLLVSPELVRAHKYVGDALLARAVHRGNFTLTSGKNSTYYIDTKAVLYDGEVLRRVGFIVATLMEKFGDNCITGPVLGAVPLVIAATYVSASVYGRALDGSVVRRVKKEYGTAAKLEGQPLHDTVAVVDDVFTTGGSVLGAIEAVEQAGHRVGTVLCLVDRLQGAYERLRNRCQQYVALFDIRDFGIAAPPVEEW